MTTISEKPILKSEDAPSSQEALAFFIQRVTKELGAEQGVVCAFDCLMQWSSGGPRSLMCVVNAWKRFLGEVKRGEPHYSTERHGARVPSINA